MHLQPGPLAESPEQGYANPTQGAERTGGLAHAPEAPEAEGAAPSDGSGGGGAARGPVPVQHSLWRLSILFVRLLLTRPVRACKRVHECSAGRAAVECVGMQLSVGLLCVHSASSLCSCCSPAPYARSACAQDKKLLFAGRGVGCDRAQSRGRGARRTAGVCYHAMCQPPHLPLATEGTVR